MSRITRTVVILLLAASAAMSAAAQTVANDYKVYVSTASDRRILEFAFDADTESWAATGASWSAPDSNFRPSDMVVGPDGHLYITDPNASKIWRMGLHGGFEGEFELLYANNLVSGPATPSGPEGPLFGPDAATGQITEHDSLYFNTKSGGPNSHTGVWALYKIASDFPMGCVNDNSCAPPAPVQILQPTQSGSTDGEGMAWTIDGNLLIVDRANQRVRIAGQIPAWTAEDLISGIGAAPTGIAVNYNGDIFVGVDDGRILRSLRTGTVGGCDPDIAISCIGYGPLQAYASTGNKVPKYMEADASGRLWVAAAAANGKGGELWEFPAASASTSEGLPQRAPGEGVALPVSAATFTEANGQFLLGGTNVIVDIVGSASCNVELTVQEFEPGVLNSLIGTTFPGAQCVRYAGKGGRCVVYTVDSCGEPFEPVVKFFSDTIEFPGLLHDDGDDSSFETDALIQYFPEGEPGDIPGDPGMRGGTVCCSGLVAVDLGTWFNHEPVASILTAGGTYGANTLAGTQAARSMTLEAEASDVDTALSDCGTTLPCSLPDTLTFTWSGPFIDAGGNPVAAATGASPAVFLPLGVNAITLVVADLNGGSSGVLNLSIEVVDITAPQFTGAIPSYPDPFAAEDAAGASIIIPVPSAADETGSASVTGAADNGVTLIEDAGTVAGQFPLGITTITWTATDGAGNAATAETVIEVTDQTPPSIEAPADISVEFGVAVDLGSATISDNVSVAGAIDVANDAPASFPLGDTIVTWTATDEAGLTAEATQTVTIVDTTAPALTAPADVTAQLGTAVSIGTATCSDANGCTVSNNAPASFPLGTTVVTWTATDGSGNTATATQNVMIVDTLAPTGSATTSPSGVRQVNHKMVNVAINVTGADNSGSFTATITGVTSSEAADGTGDGATNPNDYEIVVGSCSGTSSCGLQVQLRAERAGTGPGTRTYFVHVTLQDASGNSIELTPTFTVTSNK